MTHKKRGCLKSRKAVILNLFQNLKMLKTNNYEKLKRACLPTSRSSLTRKTFQTASFKSTPTPAPKPSLEILLLRCWYLKWLFFLGIPEDLQRFQKTEVLSALFCVQKNESQQSKIRTLWLILLDLRPQNVL